MAEASRGSKRNALTQYCNEIKEDDRSRVYRFQILLPSGVNRRLTSHDPSEEISVFDLLGLRGSYIIYTGIALTFPTAHLLYRS